MQIHTLSANSTPNPANKCRQGHPAPMTDDRYINVQRLVSDAGHSQQWSAMRMSADGHHTRRPAMPRRLRLASYGIQLCTMPTCARAPPARQPAGVIHKFDRLSGTWYQTWQSYEAGRLSRLHLMMEVHVCALWTLHIMQGSYSFPREHEMSAWPSDTVIRATLSHRCSH